MDNQLTHEDLNVILESLEYSKRNIREARGTPPEVKKEKLSQLDAVAAKVRNLKKNA